MRIKLSKQNWRLVGQKMGWLKRAQIETNNGAGVGSTGAAEAMGLGKGKITPGSLKSNKGKVDEGMKYNETPFNTNDQPNIRLDQGLLTDYQSDMLKHIDEKTNYLSYFITKKDFDSMDQAASGYFGSIKDQNGNRSGPITVESLEDSLKNWGAIDLSIKNGRDKNAGHGYGDYSGNVTRTVQNNYTPAQLQRFEKAVAERRQKLERTKGLVRNAFLASMAGKPQIQNTGGLDFTGNVKL